VRNNGWLQSVTHPNLPTQSFTYNSLGQRLTWTDGTQVTTYGYDTQDRLTFVDGPLTNDTVTYGFDAWGRSNQWTYDGASETYTFDALGRIATVTNPLGTFTRSYDGNSNVLTSLAYPVAGLNTTLSYLPLNQDGRLSQILHEGPGNVEIAKFGYTYHADGSIATWEQTQPGLTGRKWEIQQDLDKQLSSIVELPLSGPPPSPQRTWHHQYDRSGNRTLYQQPGNTTTATYNSRNQLTTLASGGATWFRGQVNEAAQVTVGGQSATVQADGTFDAVLPLGPGVHDVAVTATDKAANTTSETWRVDNGSSAPRTFTYDADGNTLSDGLRTYTWDAKNRLTSVADSTNNWTFDYSGQNLRKSEKKNGTLVRQWIWANASVVEERSAAC
jgi:YD repeat-containing protein